MKIIVVAHCRECPYTDTQITGLEGSLDTKKPVYLNICKRTGKNISYCVNNKLQPRWCPLEDAPEL